MTPEVIEIAYSAYKNAGSYAAAARELGVDARTVKRRVEAYYRDPRFSTMAFEAERTGTPIDKVSHYWLKTRNEEGDDVSLFVKNHLDAVSYDELRERLIEDIKSFAPTPPKIPRLKKDIGEHLLVLDPADVHLGKLAVTEETGHESYDLGLAVKRTYDGCVKIIERAHMYGLEKIAIIVGNDILHIDSPRRTTTSGTPQDTDGQWWQHFEAGRRLYVDVIEYAKQYADVQVIYCPSNHDYMLGFGLADSIYSWYRNDKNVDFSDYGKSIVHRKYIQFGWNLIGVTHGDGAKNKDLQSLMQHEAKSAWADTKFAYWYIHHFHHKNRITNNVQIEKDYTGVTVINYAGNLTNNIASIECIRSPSPADSWHARNGYVNYQALEGFIHHPTDGQVGRITTFC